MKEVRAKRARGKPPISLCKNNNNVHCIIPNQLHSTKFIRRPPEERRQGRGENLQDTPQERSSSISIQQRKLVTVTETEDPRVKYRYSSSCPGSLRSHTSSSAFISSHIRDYSSSLASPSSLWRSSLPSNLDPR
jgi:hypothetical protein